MVVGDCVIIFGIIINNKIILKNMVIFLVVLGFEVLFYFEVFDCFVKNYKIYVFFWLCVLLVIIFFVNLFIIGDIWKFFDYCLVCDYF